MHGVLIDKKRYKYYLLLRGRTAVLPSVTLLFKFFGHCVQVRKNIRNLVLYGSFLPRAQVAADPNPKAMSEESVFDTICYCKEDHNRVITANCSNKYEGRKLKQKGGEKQARGDRLRHSHVCGAR